MPLCKKLLTARKNGAEKEVGAAFMLNEIQKDANPTPRQTITNYAKSLSREERVIDRYPRGGTEDFRNSPLPRHGSERVRT